MMKLQKKKGRAMKRLIKNFSNYYWKDGNVYSKKTNKQLKPNQLGQVRVVRDDGGRTALSLRKLSRHFDRKFKPYKQIEVERGVIYKPMFNNPHYLFCEDVEDSLKIWSEYNNYYNTPYRIKGNNHLRYSINGKRIMFYAIVWQYYHQQKIPRGCIIHHRDGNQDNQDISNLQMMTKAEHNRVHKKGKKRNKQNQNSF